MKAREVKGLDPDGPLADNLARIVRTRTKELYAFMPRAREDEAALHDMRIAAKRLRYVLEVAHPVFGEYAERAVGLVKDLQELLGDIHDADVQLPEVREILGAGHPLVTELQALRVERFVTFLERWEDLQRKGFRARLKYALRERAGRGSIPTTVAADG